MYYIVACIIYIFVIFFYNYDDNILVYYILVALYIFFSVNNYVHIIFFFLISVVSNLWMWLFLCFKYFWFFFNLLQNFHSCKIIAFWKLSPRCCLAKYQQVSHIDLIKISFSKSQGVIIPLVVLLLYQIFIYFLFTVPYLQNV